MSPIAKSGSKSVKEVFNNLVISKIWNFLLLVQELETDKVRLSVEGEALRKTIIEMKAHKDVLNKNISDLKEEKETAEEGKAYYNAETEKLIGQNKELEHERDYYKDEMNKMQTLKNNIEQERDFFKEQTSEVKWSNENLSLVLIWFTLFLFIWQS